MESLDSFRCLKDEKKSERNRTSYYQSSEKTALPRYPRGNNSFETPREARPRSPLQSNSQIGHYYRDSYNGYVREKESYQPLARRFEREGTAGSKGSGARDAPSLQRTPASHRISHAQTSVHSRLGERVWIEKGSISQLSHTHPPRPPREAMIPNQEVNSSMERRPALERIALPVARTLLPDGDELRFQDAPPSHERISALNRLEAPIADRDQVLSSRVETHNQEALSPQERVPALQRITPPVTTRVPILRNGAANSDSGRLQDVEVYYLEDTFPMHILNTPGGPSSSRLPAKERLSLPQISPIRSLSTDRRHQATCIIIRSPADEVIQENNDPPQLAPPAKPSKTTKAKAAGKRKATEQSADLPPTKKRVVRSPLQGVSLKKRRIAKVHNSPRSKPVDANARSEANVAESVPPPGTRAGTRARNQQRDNPPVNLIPALTRRGTDFRTVPNTLL